MAGTSEAEPPLPLTSYQTALCVVPPEESCQPIDRIRSLYDKSYGRWPAHVNVLYPFVPFKQVSQAAERIRELLVSEDRCSNAGVPLRLTEANYFSQRQGKTIHLAPNAAGDGDRDGFQYLRNRALKALGQRAETPTLQERTRQYNPHLTIGQTKSHDAEPRDYLLGKARLLLPVTWEANKLVILVREQTAGPEESPGKMHVYAIIDLAANKIHFTKNGDPVSAPSEGGLPSIEKLRVSDPTDQAPGRVLVAEPGVTHEFDPEHDSWKPVSKSPDNPYEEVLPPVFKVSSYNVLVEGGPAANDRYPTLVRNILSNSALADILVLQEVCDEFLSYLLDDGEIQETYPFVTHGPSHQEGVGPLPSLRNIVVLSRWNFSWSWVPFETKHKGSIVLQLESIGKYDDSDNFLPLVVTGVHLSSGLTDNSVMAKESQLRSLLSFMSKNYANNPYIIAGDFNVATSVYSIDNALDRQKITPETYETQLGLELLFSEARLSDAWQVARTGVDGAVEAHQDFPDFDDLYEGEQGATFDPRVNPLALESTPSENTRPQRYDRIIAQEKGFLNISGFNMFGFPEKSQVAGLTLQDDRMGPKFGSDHWGIRATFRLSEDGDEEDEASGDLTVQANLPTVSRAPLSLGTTETLKSSLAEYGMLPSDEEIQTRKDVFDLVRNVLIYGALPGAENFQSSSQSAVPMTVVPVGSYGLGAWDASSDIDCLCVSSISSRVFFSLAIQRLNKCAQSGIRILRKVKAASGTMLEIDVGDVKLDIQYCPAAKIIERWPEVTRLPPNDPLFDLPISALTKLQPFRDLSYIQRTVPDLAMFRTAIRFIKIWAKQRGIYAAKFGYLGGIHIVMMLSRLYKLYFREGGSMTAADIICMFFKHYTEFDWDKEIVYDPFFTGGKKPRYRRYVNESMVILTLHAPIINVARAVSAPARRTIVEELKRADELLSGDEVTWSTLLRAPEDQGAVSGGPQEFLKAYNSYIKLNIQYWGLSLAKGSALLGWLESRCLRLLGDLDKRLPGIHTRIWPARFTLEDEEEATTSSTEDREYQGCYLVGLARRENANETEPTSREERRAAQDTLQMLLQRFTSQIQGEEAYFDPSQAWIEVTHVKQSDVADLSVDKREWGDYIVPDAVDDDDEEEEQDSSDEDLIDPEAEESTGVTTGTSPPVSKSKKSSAKSNRNRSQQQGSVPKNVGKLRPAADILSRLRWDPAYDASHYVIGYEDRFLGAKEMPMENWKGEETDEEFIPLHRILYFRRRADGAIVWDRRTRRDEVFGSGAGSAA